MMHCLDGRIPKVIWKWSRAREFCALRKVNAIIIKDCLVWFLEKEHVYVNTNNPIKG